MTHNPVNAKRRQLSWRISFVYTVPLLLVTVTLVLVFGFYLRSSLISTAYSSTEFNVKKSVDECESYLQKQEDEFLKMVKKLSQNNRQSNRLQFVKYMQGRDDIVDVYYGYSDGDFEAPAGDPVDQTVDNPHEYHATPTTISGLDPLVPVPVVTTTPKTSVSKPKPSKPSPTPVGLR